MHVQSIGVDAECVLVSQHLTDLRLDAQQLRLEQVQLGLDRREVSEVALQRLLYLVMLEQNSRGQREPEVYKSVVYDDC